MIEKTAVVIYPFNLDRGNGGIGGIDYRGSLDRDIVLQLHNFFFHFLASGLRLSFHARWYKYTRSATISRFPGRVSERERLAVFFFTSFF